MTFLISTGSVEERLFSNGQKNGPAIIKFSNGDRFEFNYKNGEMEGIFQWYQIFKISNSGKLLMAFHFKRILITGLLI